MGLGSWGEFFEIERRMAGCREPIGLCRPQEIGTPIEQVFTKQIANSLLFEFQV